MPLGRTIKGGQAGQTEIAANSQGQIFNVPNPKPKECIKKVWEVNPLECPKCGSEMKIISFIDERLLVCHILKHLNLWQERIPKGLPPPEDTTAETIVCEEFDDGWGSYSDPDFTMH